jgi:hypothetical protein
MKSSNGVARQPASRVVLLGASNLTRGISTIVELSRSLLPGPLEIMAALGHGRSYGQHSRVLGRGLSGITECGLWSTLADRDRLPTAALITDIGNDLLYQTPVPVILSWVERCVQRLEAVGARTVMTLPPVCNLENLPEWRFLLFRTLFFPRHSSTLGEIARGVMALEEGLEELAARHAATLVRQRAEWYGLDPIHIQIRHWPTAWSEILSHWSQTTPGSMRVTPSPGQWLYLRTRAPERRWLWGFEQQFPQPAGRLPDGTTVALY